MDREVIARAPASVANVIVGFDLLGFSIPIMYDEVKIRKIDRGVRINSIHGVTTQIPRHAPDNTAGFALLKMIETENLDFGFEIDILKGIPLGSGLGGSAASAVAAVVAANELLEQKLPKSKLFQYAIQGESVASGNFHGDNIGASLYGGLIGCINKGDINDFRKMEITSIPFPDTIRVVVAHPNFVLKTKEAREIIKPTVSLQDYVKQSMNLASFIIGCFKDDINIFKSSLEDIIIEPQRSQLILEFKTLKGIAMDNQAIGFSISGAGPTMFALCESLDQATAINSKFKDDKLNLEHKLDTWVTEIDRKGAYVVEDEGRNEI